MLVEPDEALRDRLARELRPLQVTLHAFATGDEALPALTQHPPDVLVVDAKTQPGDGFLFVQQVRRLLGSTGLPILLTSDVVFRQEVLRSAREDFGFDDFLAKPYTLQRLLGKLQALANARPAPAQAAPASTPPAPASARTAEPCLVFLDQLGRVSRDLRTGCLRGERDGETVLLHFRNGKLVGVGSGYLSPAELGDTLVGRKLVDGAKIERLLLDLGPTALAEPHRLGQSLIERGLLRPELLAELLAESAALRFKRLFGWASGSFAFLDGQSPQPGDLRFAFDLPSLIFEALCDHPRLQLLRELIERYPGTVRVAAEAADALSGVKLNAAERRLLLRLNHKTILRLLGELGDEVPRGPVVVLLLVVLGLLEADSARGNELRERIFGVASEARGPAAGGAAPPGDEEGDQFERIYGRAHRHLSLGQMVQAEEDFARAVQLRPADARALCHLGWCRYQNSKNDEGFQQAMELSRQAEGLAPGLLAVQLLRGRMLLARGRRREASAAVQRALELEPGNAEAREVQQLLLRLPREPEQEETAGTAPAAPAVRPTIVPPAPAADLPAAPPGPVEKSSSDQRAKQTTLDQLRAWAASDQPAPPAQEQPEDQPAPQAPPAQYRPRAPSPERVPTLPPETLATLLPQQSPTPSQEKVATPLLGLSADGSPPGGASPSTLRAGGALPGQGGAPDEGAAFRSGTELGANFILVRRLGAGGMGQVFEALDRSLGRKVAIKIMSPATLASPGAKERFRQEARALARINCPQIIQIYSLDLEFDPPFLVLEYVNGSSLKEVLRERQRLPVRHALQITLEVVRGLRVAYDKGIIHRDINPRNVMLSADGEVKIGDFGLAKSRVWDHSVTQDRAILGTPLYMSPEQWKGEPADFHSDIYSLGITLYHLITGTSPFDAETVATVMLKHLSSPLPDAIREVPGVTPELMKLLRRMTAKDPGTRPASYPDLQQDVQALLSG